MATRKRTTPPADTLRPEYDLSALRGAVRGKYYERARAGTNLVLLKPDIARAFPDSKAVNDALGLLLKVARAGGPRAEAYETARVSRARHGRVKQRRLPKSQ